VTLWVPVVVSAAVQLSAAAWLVRVLDPAPASTVTTFALAAVGPIALMGARRWPGPVVAIATAAAVAMLLVGVNGGPPPVALAFAVVGAVVLRGVTGSCSRRSRNQSVTRRLRAA
jgi:hypothetical protein